MEKKVAPRREDRKAWAYFVKLIGTLPGFLIILLLALVVIAAVYMEARALIAFKFDSMWTQITELLGYALTIVAGLSLITLIILITYLGARFLLRQARQLEKEPPRPGEPIPLPQIEAAVTKEREVRIIEVQEEVTALPDPHVFESNVYDTDSLG